METRDIDTPLSQSSVSLKLEEIQERCSKLMDKPGALFELTLQEPAARDFHSNDPYNRHRS